MEAQLTRSPRTVRILAVAVLKAAAVVVSTAIVWTMAPGASSCLAAAVLPVGPFVVQPPDMILPPGIKRGALRRIMQPFGPWTLICDENLTSRKRICNVSQTIIDPAGRTVFSWSLAASQNGAPIFVLRVPAALAEDHFVQVIFGKEKPFQAGVILSTCDAATCLGYLEVNANLQRQIAMEAQVAVKVRIGPKVQTYATSLDGLKQAVSSLK